MSPSPSDPPKGLDRVDPSLDHFERLGLARSVAISRDQVETAYLERSRQVHPDRFAGADETTRRRALDHTSLLNEAYEVLKSPLRRAEYLVKLGGIDLDSTDVSRGAPHPSQSFLMDMIERRERLDEPDDGLDDLRAETEDERERAFDAALEVLESRAEVRRAAEHLVTVRYLDRFLSEIERAQG